MEERDTRSGIDPYFVSVLILAIAFASFWITSTNYVYGTFNDAYFDMGQLPSSLFMHLYYPGLTQGLQYLVFGSHVSILAILLIPGFALWSSAMYAVALQDIFLALAGVMAYIICGDIVKNRPFGLIMAILFFLNAGLIGAVNFNVHLEGFLPFLYLLSFYLYMKGRLRWFLVSIVFLLSIMETMPFIAATLIAGLLFYEYVHYAKSSSFDKTAHKHRLAMLGAAFILIIAFELFYVWAVSTLLYDYSIGMHGSLPPDARVIDFVSPQVGALINPSGIATNQGLFYVALLGAVMLFLSFGITSLLDPILTAIFLGQWLIEVFILRNWAFALPNFQYYLYAIGSAFVAAIIGISILQERKRKKNIIIDFLFRNVNYVRAAALPIGIAVSIMPFLLLYGNMYSTMFGFLYHSSGTLSNYAGIDDALASIPYNATVMAQSSIYPHLEHNMQLELSPEVYQVVFTSKGYAAVNFTFYWFKPQYIAIDRNNPTYDLEMNSSSFNVYSYMGDNYSVYYNSTNGFEIFELK
jgi:uncharacterized membrane protein